MIDFETGESGRLQADPAAWSQLARGALETLMIVSCFAATGLAWAAIREHLESHPPRLRDASAQTIYAVGVTDESPSSSRAAAAAAVAEAGRSRSPTSAQKPAQAPTQARPSVWLVDGFNVLHVVLLGGRDRSKWWTESKRQVLLGRVAHFEDTEAELWIVFDGRHDDPVSTGAVGPRCLFAPSADAWLIERVGAADDPSRLAIVTADRQLAGRARSRGAQVVSPQDFLARCPVEFQS